MLRVSCALTSVCLRGRGTTRFSDAGAEFAAADARHPAFGELETAEPAGRRLDEEKLVESLDSIPCADVAADPFPSRDRSGPAS